ncbi:unnamed protein product [Caenorhabditis auriculariae]|uniref:Uncharacterized protein n=1 Tax=Caenorhabditis auriculariae TaxID=2777116 RepID=A0A8S1HU95_9PELO|nr:unnamed protein product [Caenorhabditis auriculariae]
MKALLIVVLLFLAVSSANCFDFPTFGIPELLSSPNRRPDPPPEPETTTTTTTRRTTTNASVETTLSILSLVLTFGLAALL